MNKLGGNFSKLRYFSVVSFLILLSIVLLGANNLPTLKGRIIVIDPGHGGSEPGAVGVNNLREADINLKTAHYLRELLEASGATVILTRGADFDVTLAERVQLVRRIMPDVFVSVHYNATEDKVSDYLLTFFAPDAADYSRNLAAMLFEELQSVTGLSGYVGPGSYYVLRNSPVPAVLGEPCHISYPPREEWLSSDDNLRLIAKAYFNAIVRLFTSNVPYFEADKLSETTVRNWKLEIPFTGMLKDVFARIDNTPIKASVYEGKVEIEIPSNVAPGNRQLVLYGVSPDGIFSNKVVLHFNFLPEPDILSIEVYPSIAPALAGSFYCIRLSAFARNHKVNLPVVAEVDKGVCVVKDSMVIVPYMGYDTVTLSMKLGEFLKDVSLNFQGSEPVEVIELIDRDSGNLLGILEKKSEKLTIQVEGYETLEYTNVLKSPVLFTQLTLTKTTHGILKDKIILIVFKELTSVEAQAFENFIEFVRPLVKELKVIEVKTKRDELEVVRHASKSDIVVFKNIDVSQIKVPKVEFTDADTTFEGILKALIRK